MATSPSVELKEGWLARGDLSLRTHRWQAGGTSDSGPVVVLMHGYAEHGLAYDDFARYLVGRGMRVCALDARGHGQSPGQRGHVRSFDDYVDDLQAFVAQVATELPERPLFLLGHSNGGLISARLAQRGGASLRGLVLSSPMFGLQPKHMPLPKIVAGVASKLLWRLPVPNGLKFWELTRDEAMQKAAEQDKSRHRWSTPRWYHEALVTMEQARVDAPRIRVPLLTLLGEADPIVKPEAIAKLHELTGSQDRTLMRRPGARHEVLNETDRGELYARVGDWILAHAG